MGMRYSGESPYRRIRRVVPVTTPAAGADWTITVPGGFEWALLAAFGTLLTSAAVANREAHLQVTDGNVTYLDLPPAAVQAASLTRTYSWARGNAALAIGSGQQMPLPSLDFDAGQVIRSATGLLDVGDQWSNVRLYVVESTERWGPIALDDFAQQLADLVAAASS